LPQKSEPPTPIANGQPARADGKASASLKAPTADDQRRVWRRSSKGYSSFTMVGKGKWQEQNNNPSAVAYNFDEVTRTTEFVELIDKTRAIGGCRIRLRDGDSQIFWGGRDKDWRPFQTGRWEISAAASNTARPAAAAPAPVAESSDSDRRAAKAILALGGSVTIRLNGESREIQPGQELPNQAFLLTRIELHELPALTDADLEPLEGIAHLNNFGLRGSPNVTDAVVAHLRNSTDLEHFWFENANVGDAGLAYLERFTRLKSFGVRGTHVSDAGLAHIEHLLELQHLAIGGTQVTSAGLRYLRGKSHLAVLWLESTKIGDAGLVHLEGLSNLKNLIIFGTRVTGAGLVHLKGLSHLEHLMLGGLKVTNSDLAALEGLTSMKSLWLDGTRVGDAGLAHLRRFTNLQELDLRGTRVSDAGLQKLTGMAALRSLKVENSKVTAAGVAHLQKALRECQIELAPRE
jgi:hypothetical protein